MPVYLIALLLLIFVSCKKGSHCENATVHKSNQCGVKWEVEFQGTRYPVQNLPDALKRDKNRIKIYRYHFYNDPLLCACCGYRYLVIDEAEDSLICV